jgi:hypothetical protein
MRSTVRGALTKQYVASRRVARSAVYRERMAARGDDDAIPGNDMLHAAPIDFTTLRISL